MVGKKQLTATLAQIEIEQSSKEGDVALEKAATSKV